MDVDHMVNEASQISAVGDITGTVGQYEQSNPKALFSWLSITITRLLMIRLGLIAL